jgi:hypothetical protein
LTFLSNPTAKLPLFVCINDGTHTISKISIMSVDGEDGANPMGACVGNAPVYLHAIPGPEDIPLYGSIVSPTDPAMKILPAVPILVKIARHSLLGKDAPLVL